MMSREIAAELSKEEVTPFHAALLKYCEDLIRPSRAAMQKHYQDWDIRNNIYMRKAVVSKDDIEAMKQDLPRRITVPLTYSQINTFVAYGFMLLTQRARFFELLASDGQDETMKECCERILQRDQEYTNYKARLVQNCRNVGTFGLGVEADWWCKDEVWVPVTTQGQAPMYMGVPTGEAPVITELKKVTKREGNCIQTISPYRVFFDPGFHVSDWKRGNFVAWDDGWTKNALLGLEAQEQVVGIKYIKKYDYNLWKESIREQSRIPGLTQQTIDKCETICVTQLVVNLVPNNVGIEGKKLGTEQYPYKWIIWIANDNRVIRCEPYPAYHADWPISTSFFAPDQHETVFNSLAYMVEDLQNLVSWLMNSRMAAVSQTVDNKFVVDPLGIETKDLVSRSRIIRLTKQGMGKDVRRFIQQLAVTDTTQGHVQDMANLNQLLQQVSGVNENAMGQYNGGRRSATEARAVNTGAGARMRMVYDVMWNQHYQPQANRCLINARQAMSPEEFAAICGPEKAAQYFAQFRATPEQLVRSYDYMAFDGTQPSEKQFIAQQLMEVFSLLVSTPGANLEYNMDPKKVLKEIMELRGLNDGTQFQYPPEELAMLQQQQMMQQQMMMQQELAMKQSNKPTSNE